MKGRKFRFSKGTSCSAHLMKFAIDEIFRQFSPLSTIEEESRFSFSSPKVNLLQIESKTSLLLLSPDLWEEIRLKSHKSWFFRFFSYRRQSLFDQIATCWKVVLGVLFCDLSGETPWNPKNWTIIANQDQNSPSCWSTWQDTLRFFV